MKIKDKIFIYLLRKSNEIEAEHEELRNRLRLYSMDDLDHFEAVRDKIRLQVWNEFVTDLSNLLINDFK